eukprot:Seg6620.1 transcript_id=Seg6620.1/GoldUCD/mRNA.D3Y31 product="ATP-dependent DNA helicase RecQ" protein_id=Seg6620.1/GoldUCD/D3Y31
MFHAGTHSDIKEHVIKSMTEENGHVRIVFATTAFGMGVDCKALEHIIHFGPPNDIDDYIQESGRAGRDKKSSHAILILYPRSITGKVSPAMRAYANNTNVCRRNALLKCFGQKQTQHSLEEHFCCDICAQLCQCDICKVSGEQFKSILELKNAQSSSSADVLPEESNKIVMPSEGKSSLEKALHELRNALISDVSDSVVGVDISTGFPLCVISEIVKDVETFTDKETIWLQTSLLDIELADKIFSILSNVRAKYGEVEAPITFPKVTSEVTSSESSDSNDSLQMSSNDELDSEDSDTIFSRRQKYRACFSGGRSNDSDTETDSD